MKVTVKVSVDKALRKTKDINELVTKRMANDASLVARMAAFQMHKSTLPETFSMDWGKAMLKTQAKITSDVQSAYTTKSDSGWQGAAFKLIRDYISADRANKWYANYKSSGLSEFDERTGTQNDYEEQFDRMRKIPRKTSESEYLAYRKSNDYSVPKKGSKSHKTLGFVTDDKRQKLLNKRLKTAGLAKAGWKACYHIAGGKGLTVSQLGAKGQNKFPDEINVPYGLFGKTSLGAVSTGSTMKGYSGKLNNHVRYMDDMGNNAAFFNTAAEIVAKYMKIIFELRKKHAKPRLTK